MSVKLAGDKQFLLDKVKQAYPILDEVFNMCDPDTPYYRKIIKMVDELEGIIKRES